MSPPGRTWHEVAPKVWVTHSTVDATASTVVGRDGSDQVLLVDPAWAPVELEALARDLEACGAQVVAGFATHAHYDHLLWHPGFGQVPRWAAPATARAAQKHRRAHQEVLGGSDPDWTGQLLDLVGRVQPTVELPGWAELCVHDAHCPGHTALWLDQQGVLIAGDMLSDVEIPLLEDAGLQDYIAGMDALLPYVQRAQALICGHGQPTQDPMSRWRADERYLHALLTGTGVEDPRLGTEANAAAHQQNLAIVTA